LLPSGCGHSIGWAISISGWVVFFPLAMLFLFASFSFPHGRAPRAPTYTRVIWYVVRVFPGRSGMDRGEYIPRTHASAIFRDAYSNFYNLP
jgi:hypothetical protein